MFFDRAKNFSPQLECRAKVMNLVSRVKILHTKDRGPSHGNHICVQSLTTMRSEITMKEKLPYKG